MKTYLINLDRSSDRLAVSSAQLNAAGIAFTRVAGKDASAFAPGELSACCNRLRFFLMNGRRVKPSEVGCAVSHAKACGLVAKGSDAFAAVLEDDTDVNAEAFRTAERLITLDHHEEIPTVWLINHRCLVPDPGCPAVLRVLDTPGDIAHTWGADGYIVNRSGARVLAALNTPVHFVADDWSSFARRGLDVKIVFPTACSVRKGPSTMCRPRRGRATWRWYRNFGWFKYRIGFHLDLALFHLEKMFKKK